jgi:hypothetical protein
MLVPAGAVSVIVLPCSSVVVAVFVSIIGEICAGGAAGLLALTDDVTVSTLAIKAVAVNDAFRTRSRVTRALFIPEPPAVPG